MSMNLHVGEPERHCSFGLFVRALFDLNLLRIALRLHFLVLKPVAW